MSRVLVTGARGRLGKAISEDLSNQGHQVEAVSRDDFNLSNRDEVHRRVLVFKPDIVFHPAAMTGVDDCERNPDKAFADNVEATRNVVTSLAGTGARLVHFSTDYVFDGKKGKPYVEEDPVNPLSVYGKTKLEAEKIVSSFFNHVIIRVSWLFGADGDFVSFVRQTVSEGKLLKLATDHRGSPGYIPDLLIGISEIAFSTQQGIFHLVNTGGCTRLEMGQEIIRLLKLEVDPVAMTGKEIGFVARRPSFSEMKCNRYNRLFGSPLRNWKEALGDYLENTS